MSLATGPITGEGMPQSPPAAAPGRRATSLSPNQRAWARFKRNRLGHVSLILFAAMLIVGSFAELFSNERPLLARYNGDWFVPVAKNPPELRFGGDFATPTDWHDPFIVQQFAQPGNFALFTLNTWGAGTLDYYARSADPVAPGKGHWLGTDSAGRDMTARLLYGLRVSIYFGLARTCDLGVSS